MENNFGDTTEFSPTQDVNMLLDGFEGKLTTSKWARITDCSKDTALRDITTLLDCGILLKDAAGGRSASYKLTIPTS